MNEAENLFDNVKAISIVPYQFGIQSRYPKHPLKLEGISLIDEFESFLRTYDGKTEYLTENQVSYSVVDVCREGNRFLYGWIKFGHWGITSELVNIHTQATRERTQDDCELLKYFFIIEFSRCVPAHFLLIVHKRVNSSALSVLRVLTKNFWVQHMKLERGSFVLDDRALLSQDYYDNVIRKKLLHVTFTWPTIKNDIADCVFDGMSTRENQGKMSLRLSPDHGVLKSFLTRKFPREGVAVLENYDKCKDVRVTVNIGKGKQKRERVVKLGHSMPLINMPVEITEVVELDKEGIPTTESILRISKDVLQSVYPTVGWIPEDANVC